MTFERFDVVIVPFPFTDRNAALRRPAIILSDRADFGQATGQSLMAMVTRAKKSTWPFDLPLTDLNAAGLSLDCSVRMKFFTLVDALVIRHVGRLATPDQRALQGILARNLGLSGESY